MRSLQGRLCHCKSLRSEQERSERQRNALEDGEECGGEREKEENERGRSLDWPGCI